MTMSWYPVAKVGDLKPGDVVAIEAGGVQMVLGRDGERYFAMQRQCLHRGGDLSDGIIARGHVVCAHHGWRFSTATGRHDQASDVCLVVYAVRVNGEHIEVDPIPRTLRGH
jgi:nitrite reductase/ring-hydroxylating ferredoxin subunit